MNKKQIMVNAHRKARQMEGDYRARMSLALKAVYAELKKANTYEVKEIRVNEWAKGGYHRVYVEGKAIYHKTVNGNAVGSGFKFKGYYNVKKHTISVMEAPVRYKDYVFGLIKEKATALELQFAS